MKKGFLISTIIIILIFMGCIACDNEYPWQIWYEAKYSQSLDLQKIARILQDENVSYNLEDERTISILFGKDINNENIERSSGAIVNGYEGYYHITISLDNRSKYPFVTNKKDLEPRKQILEQSMDYITNFINISTGMIPYSRDFQSSRQGA